MSAGFGSLAGDYGPAGLPIEPPPDNNIEQFTDDLRAIRRKYVDGRTSRRFPVDLGANDCQRIDLQGEKVNFLTVTAVTGVVFVYLYDNSALSGQAALAPDFAVGASGGAVTSQQFAIPERDDYVMSIWEGSGSGAATGMFLAQKV